MYALLASAGRELLYSYTDVFNRPAVHFLGLAVRMQVPGRVNRVFGKRRSIIDPALPVGESLTH